MGNSESESNSTKSDSQPDFLNTGKRDNNFEEMKCSEENNNTYIERVWIVKRAINLDDPHVLQFFFDTKIIKHKTNAFKIKNSFNCHFKHWAIILELSNDTFVNIQFGRNGFSLQEFKKTEIEGENIFFAILETWGRDDCPFSFCELGYAHYKYEKLKEVLSQLKNEEKKHFNEKGVTFYNLLFRNCQHFACDIEKILFSKIQARHYFLLIFAGIANYKNKNK